MHSALMQLNGMNIRLESRKRTLRQTACLLLLTGCLTIAGCVEKADGKRTETVDSASRITATEPPETRDSRAWPDAAEQHTDSVPEDADTRFGTWIPLAPVENRKGEEQ